MSDRKEYKREYGKEYRRKHRLEHNAYNREYNNLPEVKIKRREIARKYYPKHKDKINQQKRERRKRPEIKQKEKEYAKEYHARPEVKEKTKRYLAKPKVIARRKILNRKYQQNPLNKEKRKIYSAKPEIKEKRKENARKYNQTKKVKMRHKKYCDFEIKTPLIIKIKQRLPMIRKLYTKENHSAISIAKKLKTSPNLIIGILRKNGIEIKPKIFCNKRTIPCSNGLLVKSNYERIIAETLLQENMPFIYEPRLSNSRFIPDFYLPEKDLYVEYAGLTDKEWYNKQLEKKKQTYQELNIKAIFITKPEQIIEIIA